MRTDVRRGIMAVVAVAIGCAGCATERGGATAARQTDKAWTAWEVQEGRPGPGLSTRAEAGGPSGTAAGGLAGANVEQRNDWRGGVIGAASATVPATLPELSVRGARQAAYAESPVEYWSGDNRLRYYAEPLGYDESRRCRKVREMVFVDNQPYRRKLVVLCEQGQNPPDQFIDPQYRFEPQYNRYERDEEWGDRR